LEEIEPMMVNDGFFKKTLGITHKQYSFIQWRWGMEYAMSTLMLGNGTLEGIYGTATHELAFLVPTRFASNESKHLGWRGIYNLCFRFSRK
jgi:hypothetical protein